MLSDGTIFLIVGLYFVLFLALGQNVATVLLGTGVIGIILFTDPSVLVSFIEADVFYRTETYSFITIPLYILMALVLLKGGVLTDIYYIIHRLGGKRRSPLALATVVMGGFLGAVSGSATAISAGLAVTSSPELRRYGYSREFSVALASIGGSLSAIIPPSIIIIIYASISEISIGKLFIGAIIPGVLLMSSYALAILVLERVKGLKIIEEVSFEDSPDNTVEDAAASTGEGGQGDKFWSSIVSLAIVSFIIFMIFGGIYGGIMTATEAGGIAAFFALIFMSMRRKLSFAMTKEALVDTARMTAMIMVIVIGAQFFGRFMSLSMIPRQLIALLEPLHSQPWLISLMLLIVLFFLGMILESAAVMVMIIPITDPIITALGIDPIWFGVVASSIIMLGMLTPPVGLAAYASATAAGVPVTGVFKYTSTFALVAAVLVTPWLFIFPELVTYLPNTILK